MTNNPFITYSGHNKLSALFTGPRLSLVNQVARFLARLWEYSAPEGYEDENGFHPIPIRTSDSRQSGKDPVWQGEYI